MINGQELVKGRNDYFNHYIYLDGWSYKNRVIGTPFAVIDRNIKQNVDNVNFRGGYIVNNRIHGFHFGISGVYNSKSHFSLLSSFSKNQGTYADPFDVSRFQFSSSFNLEQPLSGLKNTVGKISIAADFGDLYKNQIGFNISVQKKWF